MQQYGVKWDRLGNIANASHHNNSEILWMQICIILQYYMRKSQNKKMSNYLLYKDDVKSKS